MHSLAVGSTHRLGWAGPPVSQGRIEWDHFRIRSLAVLHAHGPRVGIDDFMLLRGDWFLICSAFVTTGDRRLGRASAFPVADTNFTLVLCARFKVIQPDSPPADPSRYISSAAVVDPAASTYLSPSYSTPPPPWGPDTLPYSDRIPT